MRVWMAILIETLTVYACGNPQILWLWPMTSPEHRWWQPLTYALVHGGPVHLALNMLALVSFGPSLERTWGPLKFLGCYAMCAAAGGVLQVWGAHAPIVGASASLFGLFAAYTLENPRRAIISLFPFPLPAWAVLVGYLALTAAAWYFGWLPGVAHEAHLAGAGVGLMCAAGYRFGEYKR